MSVGVFTRTRRRGPGLPVKPVIVGHLDVFHYTGLQLQNLDVVAYPSFGFAETTRDSVHPLFQRAKRRPSTYKGKKPKYARQNVALGDEGGDFSCVKTYDESAARGIGTLRYEPNGPAGFPRTKYVGGFIPDSWPQSPFSTADLQGAGVSGQFSGEYGTATALGPTAWNRFKPRMSAADMGQFVGEIRQTLPMLMTSAKMFADIWRAVKGYSSLKVMSKETADHWLNAQFGWAPFLGDLVKFCNSFQDLDATVKRCAVNNGQWRRRGGNGNSTATSRQGLMSSTEDTAPWTVLAQSSNYSGSSSYYLTPTANTMPDLFTRTGPNGSFTSSTISFRETKKIWFEGKFRYWVPDFASPNEPVEQLLTYMRLYGIRVTPLLVWNLTPWSWLADWVGNIGDNISNYQSQNDVNLVAKYAYIMQKTVGSMKNASILNTVNGSLHYEWIRSYTAKTRRHASAFGFALEEINFNPFQWSILGALGIGRLGSEQRALYPRAR